MASRSRILIADEHLLIAEACKKLIEKEFDVVGVVADGRDLLNATTERQPDLVLVEIAMRTLNGLDLCEQIKNKHHAVKILFLTTENRPALAAEAFKRGASGYILKHGSADELIVAIRRVLRGESYLSPLINGDAVEFLLRGKPETDEGRDLTVRQREVLQLMAEGKSIKEVAYALHVKPRTVTFHQYRMMETLAIRTKADLLRYGIRQRLLGTKQRVARIASS